MGFKKCRVAKKSIPLDLLCTICNELLKHPVNCSACKAYLCSDCLEQPDRLHQKCSHSEADIVSVHRFFEKKLNSIPLLCSFKPKGCRAVVTLDKVEEHEASCRFSDGQIGEFVGSPTKKSSNDAGFMTCHKGCERQISAKEAADHDCISYLKTVTATRRAELQEVTDELNAKLVKLQEVERSRVLYLHTANTEIETLKAQLNFVQNERTALLTTRQRKSRLNLSKSEIQYKIFRENSALHLGQYLATVHKDFDVYFKRVVREVRTYAKKDRQNYYEFQGATTKVSWKFGNSLTPTKSRPKEISRTSVSTLSHSISPMKSRSFSSAPTTPLANR
jgi:hypothetical protein